MHFCSNCGKQIDDSLQFCPSCGSRQIPVEATPQSKPQPKPQQPQPQQQPPVQTYQPQPQQQYQPYQQPMYQAPQYQQPVDPKLFSDWDGGVLDTIVNSIIASLMITFTCGIATPWAICYIYKFIIDHVLVDGKRLKFTGTGGSLFATWIKWFLLIIITCGIYSFWVTPRLYKWIASNTHFE